MNKEIEQSYSCFIKYNINLLKNEVTLSNYYVT